MNDYTSFNVILRRIISHSYCVTHMRLLLHAPDMFRSVGQQRHMSRLFERDRKATLVFRARSRFAAGFNLATIRNVAFHESAGVFVINLTSMIVTKLANFAARWPLSAPTRAIASWSAFRSSLHGLFSSSLSLTQRGSPSLRRVSGY